MSDPVSSPVGDLVIEVENLHFYYGSSEALHNIHIGFPHRQVTALIGPSGVLSLYRKVNPWIPWELHASPHDVPALGADPFPVVEHYTPLPGG